jgi:pimeloyl-ACP methyl ester carboxylesterase
VHLVGHSFGGLVCRRTVLDGARPRSLTLLGSGPAAIGGRRAEVIPLMLMVLDDGGIEALAAAAGESDRKDPRVQAAPPEVAEFLHQRWLKAAPTGVRVMGEEITSAPDEVDALAATGLPMLVAHGEADDAWTPAEQAEMARRLGARYAVVADSVHSPACEAPEALTDLLIDFWRDVT